VRSPARRPAAPAGDGYVALVVVLLGLAYGYDSAVMAGAQLFVTERLGLSVAAQGSLHASPAIGLILGALGAARLADALGRARAMTLTAAVFTAVAAVSPAVVHLVWLDATRLLMGAGLGILLVVTPIFIAESASTAARGRIGVLYQVATVGGIVGAYLVAYALADGSHWRMMLWGSALVGALVVVALVPAPETPHWRRMRAAAAGRPADPAGAGRPAGGRPHRPRGVLRELFGPRYRTVTLFVVTLGFFVQITGVSAVGNFGPRIVQRMGYDGYFAMLVVPALIQVAGLVAALCSAFSVDRFGRRVTLLSGIAVMAVGHAVLAATFALGADGGPGPVLGFAGLLLFAVGFNSGFGAVVWVYASEGYPDRLRTAGTTMMLVPNLMANFVMAQFFLGVLTGLGGAVTFALLLGVTVLAWAFVRAYAPETRNRSLEEVHAYWRNGRRWPAPGTAAAPVPAASRRGAAAGPPGGAAPSGRAHPGGPTG